MNRGECLQLTNNGPWVQLDPILCLFASTDVLEYPRSTIPLPNGVRRPSLSKDTAILVVPTSLVQASLVVVAKHRLADRRAQHIVFVSRRMECHGKMRECVVRLGVSLLDL
jgi:hypothetical protein